MAWSFYSLEATTLKVRNELPLSNVTIMDRLKSTGSLSAGMPMHSKRKISREDLDTENTVIAAVRDDQVIWAGPLISWNRSEGASSIAIQCLGQWDRWKKMDLRSAQGMNYSIGVTSTGKVIWLFTDQFRIVEDLINHAQTRLGVNNPRAAPFMHTWLSYSELSGRIRNRSFDVRGMLIGNLIEQLSNVQDGFDWWMRPVGGLNDLRWELRLDYPRRENITPYEWSFDDQGGNILNYNFTETSKDQISRVVAVGAGSGKDQLIQAVNYAANYSLPQRVSVESWVDVSNVDTLLDHARKVLSRRSSAAENVGIVINPNTNPKLGEYSLGDVVQLTIDDGVVQVDGKFRIIGHSISIDSAGSENISVEVEPVSR